MVDRPDPTLPTWTNGLGWPARPQRRRYPTWIMRVRMRLGRCGWCWRRATGDLSATPKADGKPLGRIQVDICDRHYDEAESAMRKMAAAGIAELEDLPGHQ